MHPRSRRFPIAAPAFLVLLAIFGAVKLLSSSIAYRAGDGPSRVVPETGSPTFDPAACRAGADESWLTNVSADLQRQEYHASPGREGLQAPNRAQNLRTTFLPQGIEIGPRMTAGPNRWRFGWKTTQWGRLGHMQSVAAADPVPEGSRVTYAHEGWSEWYENSADGLEQGFRVSRRPPGSGPLRIDGELQGELRAELRDGAVDLLDAEGACVLRYDKLVVLDANARVLPSWLSLEARALSIQVDDRGATYPLVIDPLMTSPAWTAEGDQDQAWFGISVATAGDVNGDGFSDVIVGASGYDNGETDEGRAFVYYGSPTKLAITADWTAESNEPGALYGTSVATAGDVNNDGFSDIIVGAYHYETAGVEGGRVFVYHGSAAGLAASAAWTTSGNQDSSGFGVAVATAGDVNGDGFSDVIVGAYLYDNGQSNEGRAVVYRGSTTGIVSSPAWTVESNQGGADFGLSVATAGDVNGDGYSDVIVGALGYDNGQIDEGRAYVYHGSPAGLASVAAWTAESNQSGSWFGYPVAPAGDVNGDGFADVIIGAAHYSNGQNMEGRAVVYRGSAGGLTLSSPWIFEGDQIDASFGISVATAGDIDGDGYSDVIIGAYQYDHGETNEGLAVVYRGSAAGLDTSPAWTAESNSTSALFGYAVATAGDVNGDGYSDVIAGAFSYGTEEGKAFLYFGSAGGLANASSWTGENNQSGAEFGWSAGSAGDVNGDGYSDVIVGADLYDNGQSAEGRAWIFLGGASGLGISPAWSVEGNQEGALLGYALGTAGDVNGDGYSDVIIGLPQYDNGQTEEGAVWVFHGSAGGLTGSPSWIREQNQANASFGSCVATAGDVNGDGFSDVIISAYLFDNGQTDEGAVFVYHGSTTGLASSPAWTVDTGQAGANLSMVATAGDVNADGYSEVLIGAPDYDRSETDEGQVWMFNGSASGVMPIPSWGFEGNQTAAHLGSALGTAGDVNGDGFSDVIVGAPDYDLGWTDEGRVFVFHGGAGGLAESPSWSTVGGQALAEWGWSVATAGDVNGDSYSDIVVAAPGFDHGQFNEGKVWLYYGSSVGVWDVPLWSAESNQDNAGFGRVATAGDVNGDGFSDVIIGAHQYDSGVSNEGRAFVYLGNEGDGLDRIPRQARTTNSAPIDLLGGSNSGSAFRLKALGRTPAGRGRVRLQWEVKPAGAPFDGAGLVASSAFNTGAPTGAGSAVPLSALVAGLSPGTPYHWRLRILTDSPFFPRSRWLSLPGNADTETDVRTGQGAIGIADSPSPEAPHLLLEHSVPNPFATSTRFGYTLPKAGRLHLAIYNVAGRQVAKLADGVAGPGHYQATWDGRSVRGNPLPAGVYFLRLEFADAIETQKIVLSK